MAESNPAPTADSATSPYLPGAAWLLQLAEVNSELPSQELVRLLKHEVDVIRANVNFRPDESQLVYRHRLMQELIEGSALAHRKVRVK